MPLPISVIIPALNEAESIGFVVSEMPWQLIAECIVVDNGSSDGTGAVAEAAGARVIHSARGYGAACKAAARLHCPRVRFLYTWMEMAPTSSLTCLNW